MKKSSGTTPTEKYLVALCEKVFLRRWSYPNVFRDQGGGKELCDVLIVFDRDIIIFSDKSCTYPDSGDEVKDWARWFRRSISDSARQVFGAERWIRHHPNRIFLDPGCTKPLPIDLPSSEEMRLHRVVVARGAGKRCSAFFGGDSGSLMVRSDLVGDAHLNAPAGPFGIFRIGRVDPDRGYVHVFDDDNLDIVLSELDTVADFVAYLTRKEAFICSRRVVLATGEEDLLAYYLTHTRKDGEHDFVVPPRVGVINVDHLYHDMRDDDQYIAKKSADKISYLIDDLIEHISGSAASRTLIDGNESSDGDYERALRVLAAESRLARRHLARAFLDLLSSASARRRAKIRCVVRSEASSVGYCFLVCPCPPGKDYDEHRRSRRMMLDCYCKVMKSQHPALQHVVGLATEPLNGVCRSNDLVYLDVSQWTEEDAEEARKIRLETGILGSPKITHVHESEYPVLR